MRTVTFSDLEMVVENTFNDPDYDKLTTSGFIVYVMNHSYLFVTQGVKEELEKHDFGLEFSIGLSHFG